MQQDSIHFLRLEDFHYDLPELHIAQYPLEKRENAKLLVYTHNHIKHLHFGDIVHELPSHTSLFFNDTKVIPARLLFQKDTGAIIEVFLLNPILPSVIMSEIMLATQTCDWECIIGNMKRFKEPLKHHIQLEDGKSILLTASLLDKEKRRVRFEWNDATVSFSEILTHLGKIPLPPYIKRHASAHDSHTYQTVYSKHDGAVAAPTAGLHFTQNIITLLQQKGVSIDYLTLHVGAGTFQPIKSEQLTDHDMHCEQMVVSVQNLQKVIEATHVTAVGTTSMRTLESLYWLGVRAFRGEEIEQHFMVKKLEPYQTKEELPNRKNAFSALLAQMERKNWQKIVGYTEIFILPSYPFPVCDALITNFHLPSTTLIMLVAAFVGENWRNIYHTALQENYRFLSYGDSSLLFRNV